MPVVAESMLDIIQAHAPTTITNLIEEIEKEKLGSRAHLYFNLTWLRENGYVKATTVENNLRTKMITFTAKGSKYIAEITHD
jgi:DNA-binding PadR family transcriptional regulator